MRKKSSSSGSGLAVKNTRKGPRPWKWVICGFVGHDYRGMRCRRCGNLAAPPNKPSG